MRRIGFLLLTLLCAFPALADSFKSPLTIGTFTYLGENSQGNSQYELAFNTTGITAEPFLLDVAIGNQYGYATLGPFWTNSTVITRALNCPCTFISYFVYFETVPPGPIPIQLVNGQIFEALLGTNSPPLLPLPGNSLVTPGESGPILLKDAPEPGTMLLLGSGLVGIAAQFIRNRADSAR